MNGWQHLLRTPTVRAFGVWLLFSLSVALGGCRADPPPVLTQVPEFDLLAQDGSHFGSASLRGKIYVASFVFTSCTAVCPKLMERMRTIQERTRKHGDAVQLVSITVDPENDTPAKLSQFGARYDAGPRWHLLTGEPAAVEALVVGGFKLSVDRPAADPMQVAHSERFALVDGRGRVRAFHLAEGEGLDKLLGDIDLLLRD